MLSECKYPDTVADTNNQTNNPVKNEQIKNTEW